jgi:putative aldouronate transport system substrate-binding protein
MKKCISYICIVLLLVSLGGCQQKNSNSHLEEEQIQVEKMPISLMTRSYRAGGWPSNHPIVEELNQRLKIDLNIEWISSSNYEENLEILAATNQFPDIFFLTKEQFLKWRNSGLFMDVKPYINGYPNLVKHIPEEKYQLNNPEGKYLGFPIFNPGVIETLVIRQDWLDKLGIEPPETIEEFYEVAKAFVTQDPNGTGKNDTIGFTISINPRGHFGFGDLALYLLPSFGLSNGWTVDDDGFLLPMQTKREELKEFIGFLRKAYAEGILDPSFLYLKEGDPMIKLYSNVLGISTDVNQFLNFNVLFPLSSDQDTTMELVQLTPPIGPKGSGVLRSTSAEDKIVINAKIDDQKRQRILEMLDYMLSDEGYDLISYGIEGIHYNKITDSEYEILEAATNDRPYQLLINFLKRYNHFSNSENSLSYTSELNREDKEGIIEDASVGIASLTAIEIGKAIDDRWMETMINVIIGKEPIEAIDEAVDEWKASGGDQIIEEMNAAYSHNR